MKPPAHPGLGLVFKQFPQSLTQALPNLLCHYRILVAKPKNKFFPELAFAADSTDDEFDWF